MLKELIRRMSGRTVLVCGDVMLDEYVVGTVSRISPEAPVPIVEADLGRHRHVAGGAANVACNLRSLGAEVCLMGVVGDDESGYVLRRLMEESGVDASGLIVDPGRPTTVKTRIIAQNQQVVRVDREVREPLSSQTRQALEEAVLAHIHAGCRAVALSDYSKGVFRLELAERIIEYCRSHNVACTANAKPPNIRRFAGATLVSMNVHEAEQVLGRNLSDKGSVQDATLELLSSYALEGAIITRGSDGLVLAYDKGQIVNIPAIPVEVFDVVGAGDTVLSALTLALAAGASLPEAARIANAAGGAVVRKSGTATVTQDELLELLL